MLTEKNSKRLLWIGLILFILGFFIFLWGENFSLSNSINTSKFSGFGDFIGGTIGSIWSLAGVILFYVALTEQRQDIAINRDTLKAQVKALNQQIKEFELQRFELEETRKVFKEQSETLLVQRFENTFFQLLNLHHEIVEKLNFNRKVHQQFEPVEKREVITKAVQDLLTKIDKSNKASVSTKTGERVYIENQPENIEQAQKRLFKVYNDFYFNDYQQLFSHYYRNIYHIFKFIFTTDLIKKEKKQFYATLVRAQLSSDELLLITYNSLVPNLGYPNFLFLIEEFDIMQNFDFNLIFKHKFHKEIYAKQIASLNKPKIIRDLVH